MISLKIDGLPVSYNKTFKINYNFREVYLSSEARLFKTKVKALIPVTNFKETALFSLQIEYHGDFKYKNGKNKKIDLQNMDKLLIDAIFERLGNDDSSIWELQEKKVQDVKTYTLVNIKEI